MALAILTITATVSGICAFLALSNLHLINAELKKVLSFSLIECAASEYAMGRSARGIALSTAAIDIAPNGLRPSAANFMAAGDLLGPGLFPHDEIVSSVAFSRSGRQVLIGCGDKTAWLWMSRRAND